MIYKSNPLKGITERFFKGKYGREKEQFADIVLDEDLSEDYVVSNYGRVFCLNDNRELTYHCLPNRDKYKVVDLKCNGKIGHRCCKSVNVLVANAFVPKTKRDIELNRTRVHVLDWNQGNSRYSNLVWVNGLDVNVYTMMRDDNSEKNLVKCICLMLSAGYTSADMKKILGVPVKRSLINSIKSGKIFPEITSKYKFK